MNYKTNIIILIIIIIQWYNLVLNKPIQSTFCKWKWIPIIWLEIQKIMSILLNQNISYNRSTNSVAFCALQWMSVPPPLPSMQLK